MAGKYGREATISNGDELLRFLSVSLEYLNQLENVWRHTLQCTRGPEKQCTCVAGFKRGGHDNLSKPGRGVRSSLCLFLQTNLGESKTSCH